MKKIFFAMLLSFAIALAAQSAQAAALPMPNSFADEVEKLSPAVVNVSTTQKVKLKGGGVQQFAFPPGSPFEQFNDLLNNRYGGQGGQGGGLEREATSLGSGFIIDSKGIIITNNHVVADADEITVILHDDTKLKAEIIGRDSKIDIAVLRVKAERPLPFVSFGDSDKVRVGDWIIAIGNPYGLGGTVTTGIISARARDINVGSFDDFLQTDAAINRGNSGGPMFDMDGKVIGINTAIFSPTGGSVGIGFAIPSALAQPIIEQILQYGQAKRAWLGVQIQPVTDEIANALGMTKATGALVLGVVESGPAARAGVIEGDVILKFDGKEVTDMKKLPRYVAESPIGERKTIQVLRGGKIVNLAVDLQELHEEANKPSKRSEKIVPQLDPETAILGMQLVPEAGKGLVVIEISPTSDAFKKGVRQGNYLVKANQKKLVTNADFLAAIKAAKADGKKSVLTLISNNRETRFIPLNVAN